MVQEISSPDWPGPPFCDLEALEAVSARRRAELAKDYLAEADVLVKLDIDHATLVAFRKARKNLAVWHQPESLYRYPPFQFNETGVIAELAPLLAHLYEGNGGSGWREIEWLMTPHALLEAQRPVEVFPVDPARGLEAAETEFSEDWDAGW